MRINQDILSLLHSGRSMTPFKLNSTPGLPFKNNTSQNIWDSLSVGNETSSWTGTYNRQGNPVHKNTGGAAEYRVKTLQELMDELPEHLKYHGSLSAEEIAEKWSATGEITGPEQYYLYMVNAPLSIEASRKAQVARLGAKVDTVLNSDGINMNPDEEFSIRVDQNNRITIGGITDPERSAKIRDVLQSYTIQNPQSFASLAIGIRAAYVNNSQQIDKLSAPMRSYVLANLTASNFLYNETGGKVTLDDLTVAGDSIYGLPEGLSDLLNGDHLNGVIRNGQNLEGVRRCIKQVKAYQTKFGQESLPNLTGTFTYKNGKLTLVE
ncbi:MAG TPA: hypothetical protein VHY08_08280 [Bacillota bacterium]|nr:hypothetical protein [Bacillota bacterium]